MKKLTTLILLFTLSTTISWSQIVTDTDIQPEVKTHPITKSAKRIDRGIEQSTFVGKGQWFISGTASYSSFTADDFKFLILDDVNTKVSSFGVKVQAGYCFKDNLGAGLGFDYSHNRVDLPNIDINLGDDLNLQIQDYYSIQQVYSGTAFFRTYINLGASKRFGLFNDLKINLGGGQGKILNGQGEELKGTYQKIFKAGIIIQPGVTVFITDYFAVETSIGLLGLQYSRTDQITNQVYEGYTESWKANFKINLFAINLGLSFYF